MAKPARRLSKTPASVFLGGEPRIAHITGRNDPNLAKILNWYNYQFDNTQGRVWLEQYMVQENYDKEMIASMRKLPDWAISSTSCWIAKMSINGTEFSKENKDWVLERCKLVLSKYLKKAEDKAAAPQAKVISLQDRTAAKNNQIYILAEEWIDAFMETKKAQSFYDFLKGNSATPSAANYIREKYEKIAADFENPDDQLKEAYGKTLKLWKEFYTNIVEDCDRYVGNKKISKVRKPRTVKAKPVSKLVEKVKYQKEDAALKLVSANPEGLLGAQQVWTYNTRYKQLCVYIATDNIKGLGIKGTTLTGFDEKQSISKGLRKPEATLQAVLTSGKLTLRKILDGVKSAPRFGNGRINENTIILRIVK